MESGPSVCCVMLVDGRREMVAAAVECFRGQTYRNRTLLILDTGLSPAAVEVPNWTMTIYRPALRALTIGELRNTANQYVAADLIAHWDSDDWSGTKRIADQVALIERDPRVQVAGYRDMCFWHEHDRAAYYYRHPLESYCVGSSLIYRTAHWAKVRFLPTSSGEDFKFWISSRADALSVVDPAMSRGAGTPLMCCRIHPGNTALGFRPGAREWNRAPHWDVFASKVMDTRGNKMSFGIAVCSDCNREVHQGNRDTFPPNGWFHCSGQCLTPQSCMCEGARAVYLESREKIVGEFCGMDDLS